MKPVGSPPKVPTRKPPVDVAKVIPRIVSVIARGDRIKAATGGQGEMPQDLPVILRMNRVMGVFSHSTAGDSEGLMGFETELEFFVHKHTVTIKCLREPRSMWVLVDGVVVWTMEETGDDLPTKGLLLEEILRDGNGFIEQNDLQPGDFVDTDGTITREADDEIVLIEDDDEIILVDDEEEIEWDD